MKRQETACRYLLEGDRYSPHTNSCWRVGMGGRGVPRKSRLRLGAPRPRVGLPSPAARGRAPPPQPPGRARCLAPLPPSRLAAGARWPGPREASSLRPRSRRRDIFTNSTGAVTSAAVTAPYHKRPQPPGNGERLSPAASSARAGRGRRRRRRRRRRRPAGYPRGPRELPPPPKKKDEKNAARRAAPPQAAAGIPRAFRPTFPRTPSLRAP